jgi:hypothetical protein
VTLPPEELESDYPRDRLQNFGTGWTEYEWHCYYNRLLAKLRELQQ